MTRQSDISKNDRQTEGSEACCMCLCDLNECCLMNTTEPCSWWSLSVTDLRITKWTIMLTCIELQLVWCAIAERTLLPRLLHWNSKTGLAAVIKMKQVLRLREALKSQSQPRSISRPQKSERSKTSHEWHPYKCIYFWIECSQWTITKYPSLRWEKVWIHASLYLHPNFPSIAFSIPHLQLTVKANNTPCCWNHCHPCIAGPELGHAFGRDSNLQ